MHIHRHLVLSILPSALALPGLQKRLKPNAPAVVKDISLLGDQLISLNKTVNKYKNGNDIDAALRIQDGALNLYYAINNITKDVNASKPFTEDESATIAIDFLGIVPNISSLLDNLARKKPVFDKSFFPLAPVIIEDLKDEQAAADRLGPALKKKLTATWGSAEPPLLSEIDGYFNKTISAFMKS